MTCFKQKDKGDRLAGGEILDGPYPHDAIQDRRDRGGVHAPDELVKDGRERLLEGVPDGVPEGILFLQQRKREVCSG